MRLQTDTRFEQTKIKDLNDKITLTCSQQMFVVGNHFLPNKKLKKIKIKKRTSKVKLLSDQSKSKIIAATIIKRSADNMNNVISEKYGISPNNIETK